MPLPRLVCQRESFAWLSAVQGCVKTTLSPSAFEHQGSLHLCPIFPAPLAAAGARQTGSSSCVTLASAPSLALARSPSRLGQSLHRLAGSSAVANMPSRAPPANTSWRLLWLLRKSTSLPLTPHCAPGASSPVAGCAGSCPQSPLLSFYRR